MKLKAPDDAAAIARSPVNWFPSIFLAAFLTIMSADDAQTSVEGLNPAEQWVVERVTAGEIADLSRQFSEENRKLSVLVTKAASTLSACANSATSPDSIKSSRHSI